MQNFYCERFGSANVVMIKDSNPVDTSKLISDKAYIQITYVEPYFDVSEQRQRITVYERNFNISTQMIYMFSQRLLITSFLNFNRKIYVRNSVHT